MSCPDLSIVVPTYNSSSKMGETLSSLENAAALMDVEVIFVDDGSVDGTFDYLQKMVTEHNGWIASQLNANSGSAAAPRNKGIELASGRYIYFLDADDVLNPEGLKKALELALKWDYDVVRTALKVRFGDGTEKVSDTVPRWDQIQNRSSRIRAITKHQSLTCSFLVKKDLLKGYDIWFDESRRIGEDIKFTSRALCHADSIGLTNEPSRIYVRTSSGAESVTQKIDSKQFIEFIHSWEDVEIQLKGTGVSFLEEHGYAAIFYALKQFVWFKSEPISEEAFREFARFCGRHREIIQSFPFISRYRDIIISAIENDFNAFEEATRLRIVIAGHDLKFLRELIPCFEGVAEVRIDQWTGHTQHDEGVSNDLVEWADLIWCEWLLGASVWYSRRKRSDQKLVVRVHRSEMTGNYGVTLDWSKVAAFVAVSPHTLGDFSDRFDIPREKFWLIPNAIDTEGYQQGEISVERLNRVAMVGILPKLKGFKKAIQLLSRLRKSKPDLELWVYGKRPEELEWLMRIDSEREYFESCSQMIEDLGLEDAIIYQGWVDTKQELSQVGAVLSLSDYEGQHLAVAEGFAAGGVGLSLRWRGAEQSHPKQFVFEDIESLEMALNSLLSDPVVFKEAARKGQLFVEEIYGLPNAWERIRKMLLSIRA